MASSSSIVIEELDSTGNPAGRSIVLIGSGLPFMGAEWAMRVNVKTTWYPGNGDEGTQQVLGPQELPSKWNGEWRRTMLGRTPVLYIDETGATSELVAPQDVRDIFETIARGGMRLRVSWLVSDETMSSSNALTSNTVQRSTVREGRMSELHFAHGYDSNTEWSISFDWVSRGGTATKVTSTRSDTVNSESAAYLAALQGLIDANTEVSLAYLNPSSLTLGQLEAFANTPTAYVNSLARSVQQISSEVGQVVNLAKTIATQPTQIANRALALARNTIAQVNNFKDTISQIPAELQSTKSNVADFLRATKSFSQQSDAAVVCARAGQQFGAKLTQQVQPMLNQGKKTPNRLGNPNLANQLYVTRDGDTPHSVSQEFFGTPDHAVDLLYANRLPWHTPTFTRGRVIVIPQLPSTSATSGV